MNNRGITGEQWYSCERCGRDYPRSYLTYQTGDNAGLLVCVDRCLDNTEGERHAQNVSRILGQGQNTESQDLRFVDRGFFGTESR